MHNGSSGLPPQGGASISSLLGAVQKHRASGAGWLCPGPSCGFRCLLGPRRLALEELTGSVPALQAQPRISRQDWDWQRDPIKQSTLVFPGVG